MKYTKLFNNHNEYVAYTGGTSYITPNVSYCIEQNESHSSFATGTCQPSSTIEYLDAPTYPKTVAATATSFAVSFNYKEVIVNSKCEQIIRNFKHDEIINIEPNTTHNPKIIKGECTYSGNTVQYKVIQEAAES